MNSTQLLKTLRILVKTPKTQVLFVLCMYKRPDQKHREPVGAFPTDIYVSHGTSLKRWVLLSSLQSVFFSVDHCAVCCIADTSLVVSGKKFSKLVKDIFATVDIAHIPVYIVCYMDF